jgi:large subunit ribosomal protein L6
MSRIGKTPIEIPKNVQVEVKGDQVMTKGPKGTLTRHLMKGLSAKIVEGNLIIEADESILGIGKFHGLTRALLMNMVKGVAEGYEKRLSLVGVGFRAAVAGSKLDLKIGFSHPTSVPIPKDIKVEVDAKTNEIIISGPDKQLVGQFSADVRGMKKPEPYKGKGIRYKDEYVRKKAGKAAAAAKGPA